MGLGAAWQEESHNPQVKSLPDRRSGGGGRTAEHGDAATGHKQFVKPLDLAIIVATFVAVSILRIPLYIVLLVIGTTAILLYRPGARHESLEERTRHLRERLRHRRYISLRH